MTPPRSRCLFTLWLFVFCPAMVSCADRAAETDRPKVRPSLKNLGIVLDAEKKDAAEGWIRLFDNETLFGWKANSDLNWTVKDGTITADTGKPGLLLTTFELADYEFQCDYKLAKGGNSGIFIRTPFEPKDPAKDCYEFNMCDSHPAFATGSIVGRKKADAAASGEEVWKSIHLVVMGNRIQAKIDGKDVIDFIDESDAKRSSGHIGLQMNGGKIEFRNVRLKPLGADPIFTGKDLSGWRNVPGSKAKFEATDGTIHATNGSGFLETERTWGDFVLQFDARTNGANLNSGLFFRAEPGTEATPSNGYELQIQNGYQDGDRTRPVDAGTGAIYRRTTARKVVSNDNEWFRATLIANGPHFSIWVDGYQVTDWTDDRAADPNPRKGKRVEPGHISLQAHDASTDVSFGNLAVAEIPN